MMRSMSVSVAEIPLTFHLSSSPPLIHTMHPMKTLLWKLLLAGTAGWVMLELC